MKQVRLKRTFKVNFESEEAVSKHLIVEEEFFESGLLLKEMDYYPNGEIFLIILHKYNSDNQILKSLARNYEYETEEKVVYQYENKQLISRTEFFNNEKSKELINKYNSDSKIIEIIETDEDGNLSKQTLFDYDKKIKTEKEFDLERNVHYEVETHFDDNGNALKEIDKGDFLEKSETHNTYDENNNLVNCKMYEMGELTLNEDYFYNDAGVEIKSIGYDSNSEETTKIFREVVNNLVTKEEQYQNDILCFSLVKEYDENNQLTMERHWNIDNGYGIEATEETRYEYEYF